MVTRFGLAYLTPESGYHADGELLERLERGMAFQRRCQRPSGCIDLPTCNFDSGPDTAFGVAKLARLAWYADARGGDGAARIESALEPYLRSAAAGIADGGFHTPNHRWVIVGALAQVHERYPDERFADAIEAYLAEGIDVNEDGEYTERSHAIYSHVVDTHLIDAARSLDRPSLLDPVRRNLHTLVNFSNHDWTVETSVSRQMAASGVWRIREGAFSATVATGTSEVVSLSYGSDAMSELRVVSPYFGWGVFEGREIAFGDGSATVTLERTFDNPDRPGYWEPLGRPVAWGELDSDERAVLRQPGFELELGVERIENGLELHLRSEGGLAQVPFVVEARFPARGWLEFERSAVPVAADDPVFPGEETVTYHHDGDAITLGPGVHGHRLSATPDGSDDALRVPLTDLSPVDRRFAITAGEWSGEDLAARTAGGGPSRVGSE